MRNIILKLEQFFVATLVWSTCFFIAGTAHAENLKIYPKDDVMSLLYDDDAIADWNVARNFQGEIFRFPIADTDRVAVRSDNGVGTYRIYRISKTFDLSNLPPDITITSAKLKLFKTPDNNQGNVSVVITSHQRENIDQMQKQDWKIQNFGTDEFSRKYLFDNQYTEFQFNLKGIDYLNSKVGNIADIGLLANFDFDDVIPSGYYIQAAGWYSSESIGTSLDPYLEITYSVPEENKYPLYTQIISEYPSIAETTSWANKPFAGGDGGQRCPTIAACGCTITSMVMLARSYGVTEGIDGSAVNPGNFNDWLVAHNGYKPGGNLDFAQAVKYFGKEENGVQKSYFIFRDAPLSDAGVRQRVASGVPVVSQMNAKFRRSSEERGAHFVLITEALGAGAYGVNDPIWYNTKNIDDDANRAVMVQDYNDRIVNGRDITFTENPTAVARAFGASLVGQANTLSVTPFLRTTALLQSVSQPEYQTAPAEMLLVSPSGERLGLDPRTGQYSVLANGYYGSESFLVDLLSPDGVPVTDVLKTLTASELTNGVYKVFVVGTGSGTYTYSGLVHDAEGQEYPFNYSNETAKGMVDVYEFDVRSGESALLPIDAGNFKQVIDGEITDAGLNKFFTLWADKIMGEISAGKTLQAKQHIETFRTLMKAKKVDSPALNLLLKKLEAQIG